MIDSKEVWRWVRILIIVGIIATGIGYGFAALINQDDPDATEAGVQYDTLQERYENDPAFKSEFDSDFSDEDGITYKIKNNTIILEYDIGDVAASDDLAQALEEEMEEQINNSDEWVILNDYFSETAEKYGQTIRFQFRYINSEGDIIYKRSFKYKK